jgi:hypothetical protein
MNYYASNLHQSTLISKLLKKSPAPKLSSKVRTPVSIIIGYVRAGETPESLVEKILPHLSLAQVYDALSYYYDHQEQIEQEIIENTETYGRNYLREHLGEEGYRHVTGQPGYSFG